MGDQRDGRFARRGLEMVVKPSHGAVPLRPLDESRKTRREGRIRDDIGDMAKDTRKFLAWCASNKLRISLLLKQLERIGDQRDFVRPMPVDRGFANAGATRDGFNGERAITQLTKLVEYCLQNHLSGALDSWINSRFRSRRNHFAVWALARNALRVAQ